MNKQKELWAQCISYLDAIKGIDLRNFNTTDGLDKLSLVASPDLSPEQTIVRKDLFKKLSDDSKWVLKNVILYPNESVLQELKNTYSNGNKAPKNADIFKLLEKERLIKYLKKQFGSGPKALMIYRELKNFTKDMYDDE